jgi:hypothetical protein
VCVFAASPTIRRGASLEDFVWQDVQSSVTMPL